MDWLQIVFVVFLVAFALRSIFQTWVYVKWRFDQKKMSASHLPPVSVVIAARNEGENLLQYLPSVLEQDYPEFEVVVVNDRSIDDSSHILRAFKKRYRHLKVTEVCECRIDNPGKKFALTMGIKAASFDKLVFTDADCYPSSDQWLKEVAGNYSTGKRVVLGYGAYEKRPGLLNKLIRSETYIIGQQFLGLARLGLPYMGVGRNLAYDRQLFFDNKGFASHLHLMSGDDDLFINEVSNSKNTTVTFSDKSYTISVPKDNLRDWLEQKRRHLTTSSRYRWINSAVLLLLQGLHYAFLLSFLLLLFSQYWIWATLVYLTSILLHTLFNYRSLKLTKSEDLLIWNPLCEWFILLFYPAAFAYNWILSGSPWRNY
jgi:glycosyltransferase involved in cell wall biosynthesis